MGGKQPKITAISSCTDNGRLFVIGLGHDNKTYIWNPIVCLWALHQVEPAAAEQVPLNRQQRRHNVAK